jgi:hypothetical protein
VHSLDKCGISVKEEIKRLSWFDRFYNSWRLMLLNMVLLHYRLPTAHEKVLTTVGQKAK